MSRTVTLAAALVVFAGLPFHAAVRVTQGIFIGDALLTVTNQRIQDGHATRHGWLVLMPLAAAGDAVVLSLEMLVAIASGME
jgi:hypothetical protein